MSISGFSPIDTSGIRLQESHNPMSTSSGFEDVLGKIGMGLGAMGPAMDAGMQYAGWNRGSSITSAAVMGFMGGGGGFSTPGMGMGMGGGGAKFNAWGGAPGPAGGKIGMLTNSKFAGPGAPPGFSGGGGMPLGGPGAPPGMGGIPGMGGATDTGAMDSQINAMFNNNMVFLAMQTKVQNISQVTQMTSNIAKADSDAKLNAIRNIRS